MWCNLHSRESGCGLSAAHCSALDSRAHKTKTLSRRGHLNLWMCDMPFSLDSVSDLPRYVQIDTYQTVLDDKSGYDHILLTEESLAFFGIQWEGWYFTYNTLPLGWKISPYVYHTTGILASILFRPIGVPCSLYIDDRHNGKLQVPLDRGEYCTIDNDDARHRAAAESVVFLVAYHLVRLGYFLGLAKSVLLPSQTVPYLALTLRERYFI